MSINTKPDPTPPPAKIPKFSRYRSVRRALNARLSTASPANALPESNEEEIEESLDLDVQDSEGMSQSRSRYKRSKNATNVDGVGGSQGEAALQLSGQEHLHNQDGHEGQVDSDQREPKRPIARYHGRSRAKEVEKVSARVNQTGATEEENRRVQEKQRAVEAQRKETEARDAEQILAEQKRQDLKRLEAALEAAAPGEQVTSPREKFGFLSRKFGTTKTLPSRQFHAPDQPVPPIARARTQKVTKKIISAPQVLESTEVPELPRQVPRKEESPVKEIPLEKLPAKETPIAIKQGGGGIVPQTDVPVSASNAGERVSADDEP
jgi:hypothetical protein